MKIQRKKILGIIFSVSILFCFGISKYSKIILHPYCIECSAEKNNIENNFIWDVDSFEEDQIIHAFDFSIVDNLINFLPIPQNYAIIHKILFSVWQPPKNY